MTSSSKNKDSQLGRYLTAGKMMKDEEKSPLLGKPEFKNGASPFQEPPPRAAHKVKRKITVEPAVIGFFVAVTAANPLNQQYLHARFSYQLNYSMAAMEGNNTECGPDYNVEPDSVAQQVQSLTSFWTIILLASDLLPAFVTTILLGPYSDKAGRKKAMIPPLIGGTIRTLVAFFVVVFNLPLEFLFIGTICEGLCGGVFTMMMASFSYMADVTTKRQRPLHLLAIDICSGLGSTAANISVGYMISALGYKFPYLIILGIFVITSIYVICFLPETIDKAPDAKLFTCENLFKGLNVITKKTENKRRWKIILSLVIFSLIATLDFGGTEIVTFYLLNPPLCWNSVLIGFFISEAYVVMTIGGVLFVKFLFARIRECGLVIASCLSGLLYYFILAGSTTNVTAFMAPIGGMVFKLGLPMIRTMESKLVEPHEQGSVFSMVSLTNLLSVVVGNLVFNSVYSATLSWYHGFMYFVGGLMFLVPATLTAILAVALVREKKRNKELAEEDRLIQEAYHKGQRGSVIGH